MAGAHKKVLYQNDFGICLTRLAKTESRTVVSLQQSGILISIVSELIRGIVLYLAIFV
jgi:hypothetical protein